MCYYKEEKMAITIIGNLSLHISSSYNSFKSMATHNNVTLTNYNRDKKTTQKHEVSHSTGSNFVEKEAEQLLCHN
jgi:hypothetical protein